MQDPKAANTGLSAPASRAGTNAGPDAGPDAGQRPKTLIFHIGDRKTGSTSIQAAFAQKKVTLKGRTVFYPAKMAHNYLGGAFAAYSAQGKPAARKKAIATFKGLAQKIRSSGADFCLISAEALEGVDPAVFHDVVTRYFADTADTIQVIAYVRPHAARFLSSFSERTKNGNAKVLSFTLDMFLDHSTKVKQFHYAPRFSAWRDLFGDQFTLRPMIRDHLYQGSVVADFAHHAFGQIDFQIGDLGQSNQSLCLEDLMRLKVLQSHNSRTPKVLNHGMGWEAARVLGTLGPPPNRTKLRLHKSLAKKIHATYLEDARAIDRAFFDGKPLLESDLTKARDQAPETAQSVDPADWLEAGEMRSLNMLSTILATMILVDPDSWPPLWRRLQLAEGAQ